MLDWPTWKPTIRANLCFIRKGDQLLLMRKKRGFGKGKINAPGGKIEPGETALESAVRETFEELCVTPLLVRHAGELFFEFLDGMKLQCDVFLADDFSGIPTETPEAVPLWTNVHQIPFDEMWADDRYWVPLMLAGDRFRGCFRFDGEKLLERRIETIPVSQATR